MFGMWLLELPPLAPYNGIRVRKLHSLDHDEHDDERGVKHCSNHAYSSHPASEVAIT